MTLTLIRQCPMSNTSELFPYTTICSSFKWIKPLFLSYRVRRHIHTHTQMERQTETQTDTQTEMSTLWLRFINRNYNYSQNTHTHTRAHTHTRTLLLLLFVCVYSECLNAVNSAFKKKGRFVKLSFHVHLQLQIHCQSKLNLLHETGQYKIIMPL